MFSVRKVFRPEFVGCLVPGDCTADLGALSHSWLQLNVLSTWADTGVSDAGNEDPAHLDLVELESSFVTDLDYELHSWIHPQSGSGGELCSAARSAGSAAVNSIVTDRQGAYEACLVTVRNILLHLCKSCRGVSFVSQRCSEQGAAAEQQKKRAVQG